MDEVPPELAPLAEEEKAWQLLHRLSRDSARHKYWLRNLNLICGFVKLKKRLPRPFEYCEGVDIGTWTINQKDLLYARDQEVKNARVKVLEMCGIWNLLTDITIIRSVPMWEKNFSKLELFMKRYNRVPRSRDKMHADDDPSKFGIGGWFINRSRKTTPERLERLDMLIAQYDNNF